MDEPGQHLTGSFRVRVIRPAFGDAHGIFSRTRDRAELRRHALKLRFWPGHRPGQNFERILDLDWSWIKAISTGDVGELRIDDEIGGHSNLRVIFYKPNFEVPPGVMRMLWVIAILEKKRQDFSSHMIKVFKARRALVDERFYINPHQDPQVP